ncbi:hypothetical protein N0V93_003705 [Gnomoniopsis smithogilvyi]|uniref:Rhodopsin domain-containing protein n=1 Tax=Gnomoniopsis smithogilvyi TaxID=1191159 RepID=A0A9W8YXM0_9PEZI|nr:hypothetical protein N0V93_003705 [Gnomoniopsis smithogilvyi]
MPQLQDLITLDNLHDPLPVWNHEATIYGLVISFLIFTTICVCMRLYVRFFVTRSPGYDDYVIVLNLMVIIAANIGCCLLVDAGLGKHFVLLGQAGMSNFVKVFWWSQALYNMALALVKLSLLFQYLRIINERPDLNQRKLRWSILFMIGLVTTWGIVESLLAWIPSNPISADWDFTGKPAQRWGYGSRDVEEFTATFFQQSASNMILDVAVLTLPMFSKSLWDTVRADEKSRRGLFGLFALGGLTLICSIARFATQIHSRATTYPSFDPTWYGPSTTVLSVLEVDLATIVASLPIFWPHLRRNIASILVTHEVEIKITRDSVYVREGGGEHGAHWDVEGGESDPWKLPKLNLRGDAVMLSDFKFEGQTTSESKETVVGRVAPERPGRAWSFGSRTYRSPSSRSSSKIPLTNSANRF